MVTDDVRTDREQVVLDHFANEVAQDWDATLSTFPHPHYELVPLGVVHDGDAAVREYYAATRVAFPDQHHEMISLRHADDAVVVEFWLIGTHLGPMGPVPPTGSPFRVRMTAFFEFDEQERLVCERVYFDQTTFVRQLLAGIDKRSPRGVLTLLRALAGLARMGRAAG